MIEIAVPDMTCGHCASSIARAVKETDAAARCEIDLAARRVAITSEAEPGDFLAAIAEAGYTPALASPGS